MMMSMVLMMTQMFRNEMKKKSTYRRAVMIEKWIHLQVFCGKHMSYWCPSFVLHLLDCVSTINLNTTVADNTTFPTHKILP